jgi:2',3'-cyclic-nucleotide 2'-phosphodiesterase (5'-nucleotidase family)
VHISGAVIEYDTTRTPGSRIVSARVGGAPLDDNRSYTVVLNDFEYTGGSGLGFGNAVRRAENLDLVDLDAFVDYLQHLPQPVSAPNDKRFVIAPPARP